MVTQWMILLSVASLALGVTLRGDGDEVEDDNKEITEQQWEETFSLPIECCDYEKILPNIFTADNNKCGGAIVSFLISKGEGRTECATNCAFSENDLLNEDKSVKIRELKKLFTDEANSAVEQEVLQGLLDYCSSKLKSDTAKDDTCPSGADKMLICILRGIPTFCPDKFWFEDKEHCAAARESYWKQMIAKVVHHKSKM